MIEETINEQIPVKRQRVYYLDNLCGVLILYIIFGYHLADKAAVVKSELFETLNSILYFFMSWFFFKAGMFHKEQTLRKTVTECCSRLLVPFLLFNIVGWIVDVIETVVKHNYRTPLGYITRPFYELYTFESSVCNGALWFLFSLFIIKFLSYYLLRNRRLLLTIVFFATSAFLLGGVTVLPNKLLTLCWVGNICYGMAFYGLGYILKEKQYKRFIFLFSMIVYMMHFFFPVIIDVRTNQSNNYILNFVFCLAGIIFSNNLFRDCFNYKIPIISYVGRHSMTFYVTHFVFIYTLFIVFENIQGYFSRWEIYIYFSILVSIFLMIMDLLFNHTRLRWMVGERKT